MRRDNLFYLLFVLTIAAVRLDVFLFPLRKIIINGTILHHFWIGLAIVGASMAMPRKYSWLKRALLAAGFGLVADELVYILLGNGTVPDYWSVYSVAGTSVLAAATFVFREKIIKNIL